MVLYLNSHCYIQGDRGFLLHYLLGILSVAFYTQFCDTFRVIFCKRYKVCTTIHFFACGSPIVPAPFVEKIIFAPLSCLCSFAKDQLTPFVSFCFQALYSVALMRLSTPLSMSHCLDYCIDYFCEVYLTHVMQPSMSLFRFFCFYLQPGFLDVAPVSAQFSSNLLIGK